MLLINLKKVNIKIGENEISIDLKYFKIGYKPLKGDWVHIEVWRNPDVSTTIDDKMVSEDDVISVSPLREKKIRGTVTELLRGYGLINDNIFCPFSVCERGYKLKKGDEVTAIIMESKQARGDWRALSVSYKYKQSNKDDKPAKMDNTDVTSSNIVNNDITITENIDFGNILLNKMHEIEFSVMNNGKQRQTFVEIKMVDVSGFVIQLGPDLKSVRRNLAESKQKGLQSIENVFLKGKLLCPSMVIAPNEVKIVPIKFTPQYLGKVCITIEFCFYGFNILRTVTACIVDELLSIINSDSQPFQKPAKTFFGHKLNTRISDRSVIPGQRPVRSRKIFLPNKLAKYPIPSYLRDCIINSEGDIELLVPELAQPLHVSNYKKKLSTLVYAEEIQMEIEMREFDLKCVLLRKRGEFLSLDVPGLAEGRPSLLLGDRVVVTYHGRGSDSPTYEGIYS